MTEKGSFHKGINKHIAQPVGRYIDRLLEPTGKARVRDYLFIFAAFLTLVAGADVALNVVFPHLNTLDRAPLIGGAGVVTGAVSAKI